MTPVTDSDVQIEHRVWVQSEVAKHLRLKISELGSATMKKRRIYLDVNYWTDLADAMDGRPRHPDHSRLLSVLDDFVSSGNATCVVGDDTLLELFKRKELSKRLLLARTMDRLSDGTVIQHCFERAELEVLEFTRAEEIDAPCSPPARLVWRRPCSFLGDIFPIPGPEISRQDAVAQSKAFLDYFWELSFERLIGTLKNSPPLPNWAETADFVNAANSEHQSEVGSFDDLFLKEAAGVLDIIGLDIAHRRVKNDITGTTTMSEALASFQPIKDRVLSAYRQRSTGTALPYVDIHAGVHSAIRRNKQRRLKPNDFHDFGHAAAAIPYCSDFLTDGPLKTLLCNNPLNFDQRYGCRVVSSASEAFDLFDK